jgi:excisionase family DNA binding protein
MGGCNLSVEKKTATFELPLTRDEVAEILRISVQSLDRLVHGNKISYMKFGGSYRFTAEHVNQYIESNTVSASA